ncbi:hypothetical protein K2173_023474 [Erythroxylum novogranatense]|uniref:Prolycopene isomerase n=1 Tax=Erythroxylum novogranatense TaxID=1862640 RepID=A0AAV8TZ29_9ROSI|nr:hypothetical protein K2173_023474 [Erythroxylum novogranatense]
MGSQFFGQCNSVQLGSLGPRRLKPGILGLQPAKTPALNVVNLNNTANGSSTPVPRTINFKTVSSSESRISSFNGDKKFGQAKMRVCKFQRRLILRPKSALSVDKEVDMVGDEGISGEKTYYDAIVIGSGIGGLVAATPLAVKGAKVLVLEKYVIPGGSSGYYQRDGYTFDVGSSVMFGFSDKGNLNLITQALAAVGCTMEVIPDPTTVHFHLPNNLSVRVHREYSDFVSELSTRFPHEEEGIRKFYGECWKIFNSLNSLELKSLEEPIYLFGQFFQKPLECLTLDIAQKFIKDPDLLSCLKFQLIRVFEHLVNLYINLTNEQILHAQCFIVSTVNALHTPMINASLYVLRRVLCDRHFGGINYLEMLYKANATNIILENGKAVSLAKLLKEKIFQRRRKFPKIYVEAPSFLSIHMGVQVKLLGRPRTPSFRFEDDWARLEEPYGSIFLSIPTVLDSSLAPEGHHILHIFTTSFIEDWEGLPQKEYEAKKKLVADKLINRLEKKLFPGLRSSIDFMEVGSPKTHRRYLARDKGSYGPMPRNIPKGLLGMPFNTTGIDGLYCVGDSCFPGQGVIAVAFSGVMCAHRVAADIGLEKNSPVLDAAHLRMLGWLRTLA